MPKPSTPPTAALRNAVTRIQREGKQVFGRVERVHGLTLCVRKAEDWELVR